ncbi:MAG: DNA methyltransferase, partial [Acetobacteraceae bacterium]
MRLDDCRTVGPALAEPFLRHEIEPALHRLGVPLSGQDEPAHRWPTVRRGLCDPGTRGGPHHVLRQVLTPIARSLGYAVPAPQDPVRTWEGLEDGGYMLRGPKGTALRAWAGSSDPGLDGPPSDRSHTRHSLARVAHRVLRAARETAGLLTDGGELRLLLSDPALPDSHLGIALDGPSGWRSQDTPPDSFRLLRAIASPDGLPHLPDLLAEARLHQTRVTDDLRNQARSALEGFLQAVVDHPANIGAMAGATDPAATLWRDGLILIHRLLFVLKLESAADSARGFSFAATRLWRDSLSPNLALGPLVRRHLDLGHDTGRLLEDGLRLLFRCCRDGLAAGEIAIAPLGGALFGPDAMPVLESLHWGERATAFLLDRLLWTTPRGRPRERVHYGALDVETLGSIYESLLDLEPGIATRPMQRLRRGRQEVVVPLDPTDPPLPIATEVIPPGRFHLRSGAARKATGSYYTPNRFVQFLVRKALAPILALRSPDHGPNPSAILALRVVDPACGSGHFLVEACRFLGDALYEACRQCDTDHARYGDRLDALPDPDALLASFLPSHGGGAWAERRAVALCRRMVAVHCLYGVDRNALAIELAKLSLWLESHAEGLPLTFLDHRLLCGDSLAAPFFDDLGRLPVGQQPLDPLLAHGIDARLHDMHAAALGEVRALQATIGRDLADLTLKAAAKQRLDAACAPLLHLARAWAGAAMLATREGDDEWLALAGHVADTARWPTDLTPRQHGMVQAGIEALPWDLAFPEVFAAGGFDAVLGNPPWDVVQHNTLDFVAGHDLSVRDAADRRTRAAIERRVLARHADAFATYRTRFERQKRIADRLYRHQRVTTARGSNQGGTKRGTTAGNLDLFRLVAERAVRLTARDGAMGLLLPAAFHANEGTTGLRRLFLENGLETCLSFENRAGIFDIDSRFRFALVVARRPGPTRRLRCGFYLRTLTDLDDPARIMTYDHDFIAAIDPTHLTLLELRSDTDQRIATTLFAHRTGFGAWCAARGIRMGRDLHLTDDAHRFTPIDERVGAGGWIPLHEGKTFHQYTDRWDTPPRLMVHVDDLATKPLVRAAAAHPRLAFRDIARATDQRCVIAALLPPCTVAGHTVTIEKNPAHRPLQAALLLCAVMNSFVFDWLARLKTATHLSLYLLDHLPMPPLDDATTGA